MSFHMIAIEAEGKRIHAIADKRLGRGVSLNGELIAWEHVHDNCLKLQPITEKLYMYGGCLADMSDEFYKNLLTQKDKKPSEIIEFAERLDREVKPQFWTHKFNAITIFGVYDNGKVFIWEGNGEGGSELIFGSDKIDMVYSGGMEEATSDRGLKAFGRHLKKDYQDLQGAMVSGLVFASSIDRSISPTFDSITLEEEIAIEQHMHTSPTGKRVSISAAKNNIQVFNNAEQVLIEADDDSAVEGSYSSSTPPIPIDGNNPKNYLGSRNNSDGSFTYYYATMGPGVSVGVSPTDANGFSTLGRKEIFTNGKIRVANGDESQKTEITKTGITTTGNADVGGKLRLWNPATNSWIEGLNTRIAYSFGSDTYHFTTFNGVIYEKGTGA